MAKNRWHYLLEPVSCVRRLNISAQRWTKAGMDKMLKIDSFLRESQRISGAGICPFSYLIPNLSY
jgi:hypothetical protein